MSVSYWNDSSNKNIKTYDVCIIGGGITGLSVGYWLTQEDSNLKIAIVEKNTLGSGATGRNAGFVTCGSVEHFNRMVSKHGEQKAFEIWKFAQVNMDLLKSEIICNDHSNLSFEQIGAFSLAAQDSEFNELKTTARLMDKNGIPVEVINQIEVEMKLGATGFVGGIKYCDDGAVDPIALLKRIKSKTNVDFFENTEVSRVQDDSNGSRNVQTSKGTLSCPIVIHCTNGYAAAIDSFFENKIYPTRGQVMMLESVPLFMEAPCYANFYLDYFRQLSNGALLIGGFRQLESDTEKGFSDHTTEKIQEALLDFVKNHLPQFKNSQVTHRWAGVMGFSVDGEPMNGSLPTDNQQFFCGGFTGHGIGLAFHAAKATVDLIFDRSIPDWISARRF